MSNEGQRPHHAVRHEKRTLVASLRHGIKGMQHSVRMLFAPKWMKEYERMKQHERAEKRRR